VNATITGTPIIEVAAGVRIRYTFTDSRRTPDGPVPFERTIEGVKAESVGMARLGNQGFEIVCDDGPHYISRYALVDVVFDPERQPAAAAGAGSSRKVPRDGHLSASANHRSVPERPLAPCVRPAARESEQGTEAAGRRRRACGAVRVRALRRLPYRRARPMSSALCARPGCGHGSAVHGFPARRGSGCGMRGCGCPEWCDDRPPAPRLSISQTEATP
jgi:hypothetical protein